VRFRLRTLGDLCVAPRREARSGADGPEDPRHRRVMVVGVAVVTIDSPEVSCQQ